jgi:hypothetical protein
MYASFLHHEAKIQPKRDVSHIFNPRSYLENSNTILPWNKRQKYILFCLFLTADEVNKISGYQPCQRLQITGVSVTMSFSLIGSEVHALSYYGDSGTTSISTFLIGSEVPLFCVITGVSGTTNTYHSLGPKFLSSCGITGVSVVISVSLIELEVPAFSCYYRRFRDYEYVTFIGFEVPLFSCYFRCFRD